MPNMIGPLIMRAIDVSLLNLIANVSTFLNADRQVEVVDMGVCNIVLYVMLNKTTLCTNELL
jgi:hypothetical protein